MSTTNILVPLVPLQPSNELVVFSVDHSIVSNGYVECKLIDLNEQGAVCATNAVSETTSTVAVAVTETPTDTGMSTGDLVFCVFLIVFIVVVFVALFGMMLDSL